MENSNQQKNEVIDMYDQLKQTPPELRTSKELSDAIKRDIRCIGLIPEGMIVEGIPGLSQQEIEDIKLVSETKTSIDYKDTFYDLPFERRTEAVSQAAVNSDVQHFLYVPEKARSDELVLSVLQKRGDLISAVKPDRITPKMCMTAIENDGLAVTWIPKEKMTYGLAAKAIEQNCWALAHLPDDIKTPELCRFALKNTMKPDSGNWRDHQIIGEIPFPDVCLEHLKKIEQEKGDPYMVFYHIRPEVKNAEMVQLAVGITPRCFINVPERLKTPEICTMAVEKDWKNMIAVPEHMKTEELCLHALKMHPDAIEFIPENIRAKLNTNDFSKMENNHQRKEYRLSQQEMEDVKFFSNATFLDGTFSALPPGRKTELVCLAALQSDPMHLKYVPEKYLSDELIVHVLRMNGAMLSDIDEKRRTPEMYAAALESDGRALMYFQKETITPEAAMKAVKLDGTALEFVPENLITPELCRAALSSIAADYEVIEYVPFPEVCLEHLKKNEHNNGDVFLVFGSIKPEVITSEMAQLAVRLEPSCIQFVPDKIKTPEMCASAVEKDWMNMRFIPESMKTKELCATTMSKDFSLNVDRNKQPVNVKIPENPDMKQTGKIENKPENKPEQQKTPQQKKRMKIKM